MDYKYRLEYILKNDLAIYGFCYESFSLLVLMGLYLTVLFFNTHLRKKRV